MKFKNKKTGQIVEPRSKSLIEMIEKNANYEKIREKGQENKNE